MAEQEKSESTKAFYNPDPPYHVDEALAKIHKDPAKKAEFDAKVAARKKAQAAKKQA